MTKTEQPWTENIEGALASIMSMSDQQLREVILKAQTELKTRFDLRQLDVEERAQAEREALERQRQELAGMGVNFTETNGHKKSKGKAK